MNLRASPVLRRGTLARWRAAAMARAQSRPLRRRDAAALVSRLASLAAAGVPTGEALATSALSGSALAERLHALVRRGLSVSAAMASPGLPFHEVDVAVVRAGERGGSTARALALLGARMETESAGHRRVASALAYPLVLVSGATAALLFLSLVVLPSFQTMYRGHEDRLPSSTLALLAFGDFARAWGTTVLGLLLAAMLAWRAAWQRLPSVRAVRDRALLDRAPLAWLAAPRAAADACALLALLLESGCEAEESLELAARAAENREMRARLHAALRALRRGAPLSRAWAGAALDDAGDARPLLEVAEATGGYAAAFARLAGLHEERAERALSSLCRAAEPAAVVAMAFAVGGGVLALYQPMLGSASLLLGGNQ